MRNSGAARGRPAGSPSRRCSASQYSHIFIDFRGIRDAVMREAGFDYFENSRRETYANRAYCIANPMGWRGYSRRRLGAHRLRRAGRLPLPYQGRDARNSTAIPRAARSANPTACDDGTLAPTAALGSLPFAPEIVIPCAQALMRDSPGCSTLRLQGQLQPQLHLCRREGRRPARSTRSTAGSRRIISASTRGRSCSRPPTTATISCGATCAGCRRSAAGSKRAGFTGGWLASGSGERG